MSYYFVYFNPLIYKSTKLQTLHKTLFCDDNFEPVNGGNVWGLHLSDKLPAIMS